MLSCSFRFRFSAILLTRAGGRTDASRVGLLRRASRFGCDDLLEADGVVEHLDVVEEDVRDFAARKHRAQLLKLAVLVLVAPAAATVQAEVAASRRRGALGERVNDVPEVKLVAQLSDRLARPPAARLPAEAEAVALRLSEKLSEVSDVLGGRLEPRRALEQNRAGFERRRALARQLPRRGDRLRRAERAGLLLLLFGELPLESPVGRTRRQVRDELPDLERELEAARRFLAPTPERRNLRRLVEGVLDFNRVEQGVVRLARRAEAAAADLSQRFTQVRFAPASAFRRRAALRQPTARRSRGAARRAGADRPRAGRGGGRRG